MAEVLVSDEPRSQSIWKATTRRAGVPDAYRARFWQYIMYGNPPWLPQVSTYPTPYNNPKESSTCEHAHSAYC